MYIYVPRKFDFVYMLVVYVNVDKEKTIILEYLSISRNSFLSWLLYVRLLILYVGDSEKTWVANILTNDIPSKPILDENASLSYSNVQFIN